MFKTVTRTHKGIYGYIEEDNQVLVIIKKRGPYTGRYDLPGGSPEQGESEEETLKREIKEETSCKLSSYRNRKEITIMFDEFFEDNGHEGCLVHTGILFDCQVHGNPDKNISDLDSDGALWINKSDLNTHNATPFVLICREVHQK